MKLLKYLTIIVCFTTVTGCTPQQRLERLLTRNPNLKAQLQRDTFNVLNTVYIDTTLTPLTDNVIYYAQIDTLLKYIDTTDCTTRTKATLQKKFTGIVKAKRCIEKPLLFTDTILYADKEIEIQLPVTVLVTQDSTAFIIRVQGTGGKVLSLTKAVAVTGVTQQQINQYRKQGAWAVGGSLLALLVLAGVGYLIFKIKSKIPL